MDQGKGELTVTTGASGGGTTSQGAGGRAEKGGEAAQNVGGGLEGGDQKSKGSPCKREQGSGSEERMGGNTRVMQPRGTTGGKRPVALLGP